LAGPGAARLVLTGQFSDGAVCYEIQHDLVAHMPEVFERARGLMPFRVSPTPVTPLRVWQALGLTPFGDFTTVSQTIFYLRQAKSEEGAYVAPVYWGLADLVWLDEASGTFDVALFEDGPNMGSAGGPTLTKKTTVWRIKFALA